jgi:RNA ligase (TIGR02306 family)
MNMVRKLATIRNIDRIDPIPNSDNIEVATVDGWKVVVKKGEFEPGQAAIYLEIDSWVPHEIAPFLTRGNDTPREYNGVKGQRLRTVKLRGQVSQGLLLNYWDFPEVWKAFHKTRVISEEEAKSGPRPFDVTEILGIQKWEAPIPTQMQGQAKGAFPTSLIRKTDQERIQNMFRDIEARSDSGFEVTMKLDGSSCTIFRLDGELRVCSRNMELKINEENADNAFVRMAKQYGPSINDGLAFQGELMGPGIQGNREGFPELRFYVFDVFRISGYEYLTPRARRTLVDSIGMQHVPVIDENAPAPESVEEALKMVDKMKSINHNIAEGVVFKSNDDSNFTFKVISTKFLLSTGG